MATGQLDEGVTTTATAVNSSRDALVSARENRQSVLIQNLGPDVVYIGGADVSVANGIQLPVGGSFGQDGVKAQVAFHAICDTGDTADVRVMELA